MSAPQTRQLDVWIDTRKVGSLSDSNGVWSLQYDEDWRSSHRAFSLSPSLPLGADRITDQGSRRPVQWFFDNLLPEEGIRGLLARDAHVDAADAFGLLAYYGPESAGALTLLAPGVSAGEGGQVPLDDATLSRRIRDLPTVPLTHDAPKHMSMAGAQHKLAVMVEGDRLWEPAGPTASTHILKPDHPHADHFPHSAVNEWFVMSLAHAIGLPVPEVHMRRVPEPVYLVERFDRRKQGGNTQRLHVIDACQLLDLDRTYKYQQATAQTLGRIAQICRTQAQTRQRLFQGHVFNLLVGNGDAHLKNLSFFAGNEGFTLTPFYDLLSTAVYRQGGWAAADIVTSTGTAERFGQVRREDVIAFGEVLAIPPRLGERWLDDVLKRTGPAVSELMKRYEAGATGTVHPGEARLLRQIVHGPIRDMSRQLQAPAH